LLYPAFALHPVSVEVFLRDLQSMAVSMRPSSRVAPALGEADRRIRDCAAATRADSPVRDNTKPFPFREWEGPRIVGVADLAHRLTP